jgi:hypothetical protein
MIDAICKKCGTRYQLGTDHKCPASKKAASAAASSHRLDAQTGELPRTSKGRANGKKGAATKTTKTGGGAQKAEPAQKPMAKKQGKSGGSTKAQPIDPEPRKSPKSTAGSSVVEHGAEVSEAAGSNPALPVDTPPAPIVPAQVDEKAREGLLAQAEAAAAHLAPLTKRGTPRQRAPKGTFDRKEWQRKAAQRRRAALKAQREQT